MVRGTISPICTHTQNDSTKDADKETILKWN